MIGDRLEGILACYRGMPRELVPILQDMQQTFGYLPEEEIREVARFVGLAESRVYAVATFYDRFKFTPRGRNTITVCRGTPCLVRGGQRIREELERKLGIKASETTPDLKYTLETAACIGCCGLAPAVAINGETFGKLSAAKMIEILESREGVDE